jgi:hypothetical protein
MKAARDVSLALLLGRPSQDSHKATFFEHSIVVRRATCTISEGDHTRGRRDEGRNEVRS